MMRPSNEETQPLMRTVTMNGGCQLMCEYNEPDKTADVKAPAPRNAMYPRSRSPTSPTTMFRPSAVAAKISTCVAIDMFASDPFWVNGKTKATKNAASTMIFLLSAEHLANQPKTPVRTSVSAKNPANVR